MSLHGLREAKAGVQAQSYMSLQSLSSLLIAAVLDGAELLPAPLLLLSLFSPWEISQIQIPRPHLQNF